MFSTDSDVDDLANHIIEQNLLDRRALKRWVKKTCKKQLILSQNTKDILVLCQELLEALKGTPHKTFSD